MKKDLTDITFVLDRSGSMSSVQLDTIGGFNKFVQDQQQLPGECVASLIQFDDQYEPVYTGTAIKQVPLLTTKTFVPRGYTALLDAIGRTIVSTGIRLAALPEYQRPEKVVLVILTDGGENSSKEFAREKVFEMIGHQRARYLWDFVFIGANQDAIQTAVSLNVSPASSMSYAANAAGTQAVFDSASNYVSHTRSVAGAAAGASSFTAEDRDEQTKAGAVAPPSTMP